MAYIEKEPIVEFITKGLNNPDNTKAFGYDAIVILTEIEYAPTADVAPKSEVAREIFEEIERFILTCIENDEKVFNSGEDEYYDGRFMGFKIVEEHLAELKKKYTEENNEDKD